MATDNEILAFRAEVKCANDMDLVELCDCALNGSKWARRICERLIAELVYRTDRVQ